MDKKIILTAAFFGIMAIVLGAFGAHALKKVLSEAQLNSFEVGVRYQMYHALFLLLIANFTFLTGKEKVVIMYLVIIGVLLFSGSIFLLATSTITKLKTSFIGPLTPIGGLFLIASWIYLFYCVAVKNTN
jgi:uncharacterized membrane protein YgdD (TMEM256/DUF423 family)